ncbi:MAG: trypsin-like peptidase domain-containing protein [Clostridia bacterium]|nr:trypsin-like peptidase domain-containing protein [Clostridia bacterium]
MSSSRNRFIVSNILIAVVSTILTAVILLNIVPSMVDRQETPRRPIDYQNEIPPQRINIQTTDQVNIEQAVAQKVMPAVVGISTVSIEKRSALDPNPVEKRGVGSGVIVHSSGYILTNHHVAGGEPDELLVTLENGQILEGETLWSDPILDMAVVKINAVNLPYAEFGDCQELKVGEPAIAIGNPLGLQFQRTVTSGIISALDRTISINNEKGEVVFMEDLIQTDASINPGNSGGPLLNQKGEVIGINTVKVASAEGIGFAIPINIAKPIIEDFVKKGEFVTPYIGIFAYDKEIAKYMNQEFDIEKGIYVIKIDKGSPADNAGIKLGDIISEVEGKTINTMLDMRMIIYQKDPGDIINFKIVRNDEQKSIKVKLGLFPGEY